MQSTAQPGTMVLRRKRALTSWTPVGIAVLGVLIAAFLVLRPSSAPGLVGRPAPDFTTRGVDGRPVRLASLRGHPIILNFWGVQCIYCRKEMPLLQQAYQRERSKGLLILGIDVQSDDPGSITTFASQRSVTYPMLLQGNVDWAALYKVGDLPQSVFIDRRGIVREDDPKPFLDAASLQHSLRTILS